LDAGGGLSGKVSFSTGGPETVIFQGVLPGTNAFAISKTCRSGTGWNSPAAVIATSAHAGGTTLTWTRHGAIQFTNVTTLTGVSLMFNTGTDTVTGNTLCRPEPWSADLGSGPAAAGTDAGNARKLERPDR